MQTYTRRTEHGIGVWHIDRLWQLAQYLPVKHVPVATIKELDENRWFTNEPLPRPTCRVIAEHARTMYGVDLRYPIILSAEGHLMDGAHRVAKAWLLGVETLPAVQFVEDPESNEWLESADTSFDPCCQRA